MSGVLINDKVGGSEFDVLLPPKFEKLCTAPNQMGKKLMWPPKHLPTSFGPKQCKIEEKPNKVTEEKEAFN